jgi:ubiquinone/menaquinone biosynthesis C-methylase UbiE
MNNWWKEFFDETYIRFWTGLDDDRTKLEVEGITKFAKLNKGSKILDVPAAQGRIAIPLAQKGYSVTCVDISEFMLNQIKENYPTLENISLVKKDMRTLNFINEYDVVLAVFSPLGYFQNKEDDLRYLKGLYQSLNDGGTLILDSRHRDKVVQNKQKKSFWKYDGTTVLESWDFDPLTSLRRASLEWLEDGEWKKKESISRYYTATEIIELISMAGFVIDEIYGNYEGKSFEIHDQNIVVNARKENS